MAAGSRPLDPHQRSAVERTGNLVVSAGAGSGKTTVLAERYVRLLRDRLASVEEVLTLTYTRKAAAEMYERIYSRLREEEGDPQIREEIAHFDRAQISTLDSFCVQVLRNSPQTFGVRSDFQVGEEQRGRIDEETALRFVLDHSEDEALLEFIRLNGFERVWKGFFASLGMSYLHLAETKDFIAMYEGQVAELTRMVGEGLGRLAAIEEEIRAIPPETAKAVAAAHATLVSLPDLAALAGEEDYAELGRVLDGVSLNRRTGNSRSEEVVRYKELAEAYRDEVEALLRVVRTLDSRGAMRRIFELCGEYQELLLTKKRLSGSLSFQDIVEMAVQLLTENRALRRHYKRRFRYIMIDEFQDNNELQKRLLFLLAEREDSESVGQPGPDRLAPEKLFFVGDEKQSIYRFRGADVAVFRGLSDELGGDGEAGIALSTNYRSDPGLIRFFNAFFGRVFTDATEAYEARFEPLTAGKDGEGTGSIRLFYRPFSESRAEEEAHSDDAEALHIARFIRKSVAERSLIVRDGGAERPAEWQDFALLMRSTSNQIRYERIFRRLNIPYTTQSVRSLFLEAPLNDLYAVLQLAVYPEDRTAYATLLRSPFVNLSDASVVEVLLEETPPFEGVPASVAARDEDGRRWRAGQLLYESIAERVDLVPISSLIDDLWYRFGYRYFLLKEPASHPYLEYYDYFRKLALDADDAGQSLAEFLDLIRPNLGKYERLPELEVVRDQRSGVQLLTVHKSKGLEFPVVILANTGNLGRTRSEGSNPYYLSERFGLTLRMTEGGNYFYTLAEEENRLRERAELKRLLYVAMTRAESHLVISGCHNRQNRSNPDVLLNMVLEVVAPGREWSSEEAEVVTGEFGRLELSVIPPVTESELRGGGRRTAASSTAELLASYRAASVRPAGAERRSFSATELSELFWQAISEPTPEAGLFPVEGAEYLPSVPSDSLLGEGGLEAVFGTLVHAIIGERLAGGEEPPGWVLRPLRGLEEAERSRLVADALQLAEGFAASEIGRRAAAAPRRFSEREFLLQPADTFLIRGTFDLLFEEGGSSWIVDFKSDRQLEPGMHALQLHAYRLAAEELLGTPVRAALFYLRGARLVEVDEELLAPLYRRFFEAVGVAAPLEWARSGAAQLSLMVEQASRLERAAGLGAAPLRGPAAG